MGRTLGWLALLAAISSTGCKMGQSTYDYTGPAFQSGYQNGGFFYRRGSILGPATRFRNRPGPACPIRSRPWLRCSQACGNGLRRIRSAVQPHLGSGA